MPNVVVVGEFRCTCCCKNERQEHTDDDCEVGYMRCSGCNCTRIRMGDATQLALRVQVHGALTVDTVRRAAELASVLGAPNDIALKRESDAIHYFEVDAGGALNRLEIEKIRGNARGGSRS